MPMIRQFLAKSLEIDYRIYLMIRCMIQFYFKIMVAYFNFTVNGGRVCAE